MLQEQDDGADGGEQEEEEDGGAGGVAPGLGEEPRGGHVDHEGAHDVAELPGRPAGAMAVMAVDTGLLAGDRGGDGAEHCAAAALEPLAADRKSTRLNSSH